MAEANIQKDLDTLRADLAALRASLEEVTSDLLNVGKDSATIAGRRLGERTAASRERLRNAYGAARDQSARAIEGLQTTIEDRPFVSIVAAFGLGFVLGKMLDRR
jgi:ElaB/YqjD/DUF883 family membrane-anchored ribosome-binding protein